MSSNWLEWVNLELGAAFNMLRTAVDNANEHIWNDKDDDPPFWYIAGHVIYFCHFYFSDFDPDMNNLLDEYKIPDYMKEWEEIPDFGLKFDMIPPKEILLQFLEEARIKLKTQFKEGIVENQIEEKATSWLPMLKGELLLYNMRHIMQHVGHLNDILRKHKLPTSEWIGQNPI